jgi:hypothetical protein
VFASAMREKMCVCKCDACCFRCGVKCCRVLTFEETIFFVCGSAMLAAFDAEHPAEEDVARRCRSHGNTHTNTTHKHTFERAGGTPLDDVAFSRLDLREGFVTHWARTA